MSENIKMMCLLCVQEKHDGKERKAGPVVQALDPALTLCGMLRRHLRLLGLFCSKGIIIF